MNFMSKSKFILTSSLSNAAAERGKGARGTGGLQNRRKPRNFYAKTGFEFANFCVKKLQTATSRHIFLY